MPPTMYDIREFMGHPIGEIIALVKAWDEGRIIVPPVKVGDVVYSIKRTYSKCRLDSYWDDIRCQGCELECDSHTSYDIQDEQVAAIEWDGYRFSVRTNKYSPKPKAIGEPIYGVLLTREEAEQALKGGADK